ncbi:tRNA-splicing ligase RtcB (3'-phosphate/5'-hydroxy nucleic acid ligase) [Nematocida parisii]|nr:tRNA-splicing ligase RtcB (3'-phosphate/5'-hydroxy nucleic acid ligase) [Nematocida parisii]KAI5125558.1 tRNA-splicing ligase RtcB (3'-phosphate/5'-hydroxy nucleic acid ligase) [Nematocida parisii]KAI5141821.1 tRNA-splicing ligase RtcB (3'-phosphate/5'-hydroxy nucleic acid ligase) [Nematocida parisii]
MKDFLNDLKASIAESKKNGMLKDIQINQTGDHLTILQSTLNTTAGMFYSPSEYYHILTDGDSGDTLLDQLVQMLERPYLTRLIALPDAHAGKEFPVGISCSFDPTHPECRVVPEMIGFDINCGVRLWATNIKKSEFLPFREAFMTRAFEQIGIIDRPCPLPKEIDADKILERGIPYLIELGMATELDAMCTESQGCLPVSNVKKLLGQAPRAAVKKQLGTLGNGNHYVEIQVVSEIFDDKICKQLGLELDMVCISVHTGSRSVGGGAVSDLLKKCMRCESKYVHDEKVEIPINDPMAENYFEMVNACSNFAFCNRVMIGREVEEALKQTFEQSMGDTEETEVKDTRGVRNIKSGSSITMRVISDSAHNIVRLEERDGKKVLRIRKGSTQILPYGDKERSIARDINKTSLYNSESSMPDDSNKCTIYPHVVSVGGSMSTGSYVLSAGKNGESVDYVTCHGSGRILRRKDANKEITQEGLKNELESADVSMRVKNINKIREESSKAYKCIKKVVDYCEESGLSNKVCRLAPIGGIKG